MDVDHSLSERERRRNAFEQVVVPELGLLYRVGLALTRRSADAEDLVQETLIRAFRAIDSFDGRHPRAWLLTILRNAHANLNRRQRPELLLDPDATMAAVSERVATRETPEQMIVDEAFDGSVAAAFRALPERFRRVVELIDICGLRYEEAAKALGVPVGTVMSRVHRGRKRIRKGLVAADVVRRRG